MVFAQSGKRANMRAATGRHGSRKGGLINDLRKGFAAFALGLLAVIAPAHALDGPIPVPRPSPLAGPDAGFPDAVVPSDAPSVPDQSGLSPGALLDPTAGMSFSLPGEPGIQVTDPMAGTPLPAPPDVSGDLFGGNNPLLGHGPSAVQPVPFRLEARLKDDGPALPSGIVWRVFGAAPTPDGKLPFVGEASGGSIEVRLIPGDYFVYAAYGRAGTSKKIKVGYGANAEDFVLNAGGLRLLALVGGNDEQTLGPHEVSFDVYAPDEGGSDERVLIVPNAPPNKILGLNAGVYHIVCRYGDANAVVRADIRVEPGNLTEATMYQKAARLTLKLVSEHGGEALANTSWSVVTPQGDVVVESVGAFPSVVLAEGEYKAIARHQDSSYERAFTVEAGLNRDVEVIAR